MEQLTINLQPQYIGKFQTIIKAFGSENLFIDNFLRYHVIRLKREISRMQFALNKYEVKYNMTSEIFYNKLENGDLGDDRDFVMWSGIYELLIDSKNQLSLLI